ncbi:MAG: hypothetical protein JNM41_05825 [Flavipsychrobacter sp.]|nr:hypothetical protein [Flavipsychrobacter sp.]
MTTKRKITILLYAICWIGVFLISGCRITSSPKEKSIKWRTIFHERFDVDYCKIDSVKNSLVLALEAYVSRGGGYRILTLEKQSDGEYLGKPIAESSRNTMMHFGQFKDFLGFVSVDFEENTIRTKLISIDTAGDMTEVRLPLDCPITFLQSPGHLVVEGVSGAFTEVVISNDNGANWTIFNYEQSGYKSVKILFVKDDFLYLVGARSFKGGNTLLKLNLMSYKVEEIEHVEICEDWNFFMPIARSNEFYAFVNGQEILLYKFDDDSLVLHKRINLPKKIGNAENMFVSDGLYVVTASVPQIHGKVHSWISSDSGEHWTPYKHKEGFKLVYNTVGRLIMRDVNNDFFERED